MLQVYIKVTKIQNRPRVFSLQNKADNFTLHVRTVVSAYWPQRQYVETAVQVFWRLIYSINHCGFFFSIYNGVRTIPCGHVNKIQNRKFQSPVKCISENCVRRKPVFILTLGLGEINVVNTDTDLSSQIMVVF